VTTHDRIRNQHHYDATLALITRFEGGFNTRGIDGMMAAMTDDCVFEHVAPEAVSFGRHEGQEAVRAVWESLDTHFPGYTIDVDDIFASGERCACRWTMQWPQEDGSQGSARGVDIFTVRGGKVAEKLTYTTL
jgi:ketosteroid isomerase-like protein